MKYLSARRISRFAHAAAATEPRCYHGSRRSPPRDEPHRANALAPHSEARIADLLLTLASNFGEAAEGGNEITIRLTHQQLANMSGTTRETMNRTLNELWDAKLIYMQRTHIVVCDTAGLAALRA